MFSCTYIWSKLIDCWFLHVCYFTEGSPELLKATVRYYLMEFFFSLFALQMKKHPFKVSVIMDYVLYAESQSTIGIFGLLLS